MATRKVDLVLNPAGTRCKVLVDGEEVRNCRSVTVQATAGQLTTVNIELINVEVTVSGETDTVEITKVVADVTSLKDHSRRYAVVPE